MIGVLADHVTVPAEHIVSLSALAACSVVLVGWAFGTRLIYLDVISGLDEARSGTGSGGRSRPAWVAALAAPVVGLLLALPSGSHASSRVTRSNTAVASSSFALAANGPRDEVRAGVGTLPMRSGSSAEGNANVIEPTSTVRATDSLRYVVRPGDRLSELALRFLGSAADWPVIARANASALREPGQGHLIDPSVLPAGLVLEIPGAERAAAAGTREPETTPLEDSANPTIPTRDNLLAGALGGFGLLGASFLAFQLARRRKLQAMSLPAGIPRPRLDRADAEVEAQLRPLLLAELPIWIDATNRLLLEGLRGDPSIALPSVAALRVGSDGLALLLEHAAPRAPDGFVVSPDAMTWQVDTSFGLDEMLRRIGHDARPLLPVLLPVAEDKVASYLVAAAPGESLGLVGTREQARRFLGAAASHLLDAPSGEVECYRLGPASFVAATSLEEIGIEELAGLAVDAELDPRPKAAAPWSQRVVLVEDRELAARALGLRLGGVTLICTSAASDRLVLLGATTVRIEPAGIELPRLLPTSELLRRAARIRDAASSLAPHACPPREITKGAGVVQSPEPISLCRPDAPPPPPVEVRILQGVPELGGDIALAHAARDAVALVAYLCLHGNEARSEELAQVIGVYRAEPRQRSQALWTAVSHVRSAIGPGLLTLSRDEGRYLLDHSVGSDWARFSAMTSLAHACERAAEPVRAAALYHAALELVGPGGVCDDDSVAGRYLWLDAEQFRDEIETAVVAAAHALTMLCLADKAVVDPLEEAAWAIALGRQVRPEAKAMRDAALFLADARDDDSALENEITAAMDAVDALGLGADLDPGTEAIYWSLKRARGQAT